MTYTAHDPRLFYDAIVSRLSSQTGKNIGRVEAPSDRTLPYAVVQPVTDAAEATSLGDAHETTVYDFQVSGWGDTPDQAEWMIKEVRDALLGWTPTVSGRSLNPIEKIGGAGTIRDDSIQPPLFQAIDEFSVFVS